jgi:hypothetical protein
VKIILAIKLDFSHFRSLKKSRQTDKLKITFSTRGLLMLTLPAALVPLIVAFAPLFSKPVWNHATVLLVGAILAPGKRTVTACLRVMGVSQEQCFVN